MLAIKFTFTANRYHATQWGRHVNEGVLEWPPSPWRILRSIVAVWRRTLPDLEVERVEPILGALASEYPKFHLPPVSTGHTRHYMPYNEGMRERTTLVIDSFVATEPICPLFAVWPNVELDTQQRSDLGLILRNMPYLGRAESWVNADLTLEYPEPNSYALDNGALLEGDLEVVRTLVPNHGIGLDELQVETSKLRGKGRIDPEGAHWFPYVRRSDCFKSYRTKRPLQAARGEGATVIRFSLSGKVLPMAFDTIRWGELARKSAMSQYGRNNHGEVSQSLSGKDGSGTPLKGHRHTFYLPTDEDGDGRLDHLTVWAPGGLTATEFQAVVSINTLNPGRLREPVQMTYQSHGAAGDFVGISPLFSSSRVWRSLTPYVLTRHVKFRGPLDENGRKTMTDGPEEQITREVSLRWSGSLKLVSVVVHNQRDSIVPMRKGESGGFRPFDFFTYKRGAGSNGGGVFNFKLEFDHPVNGPLVLGFACHQGLGIFVPEGS